jgi:hypothetical protein
LKPFLLYGLLLLVPGIVGSGCFGGGGSSVGPAADPASPTTTISASAVLLVLAVNDTALSASLTGSPRTFTLTNTGTATATSVGYAASPALPSGTTISPANCGDLAPAASCVLTITPGATPSSAAGDTNPAAVVLSVSGTNTNTLSVSIAVLTYGSVHQAGYVFSVDDTTPTTGSIGGKVAALTDQAVAFRPGIKWSSDANGDVAYDDIPGIYETSTAPPDACSGNVDGACNSREILAFYSTPRTSATVDPSFYAAGLCSGAIDNYSDWYLPAVCELGYDTDATGTGCGTRVAPLMQNMQSMLSEIANVGHFYGYYWTSTEYSASPDQDVFYHYSDPIQSSDPNNSYNFHAATNKFEPLGVRCARTMTN